MEKFYGLAISPWFGGAIMTAKLRGRSPVRLSVDGDMIWHDVSTGLGSGESMLFAVEADEVQEGVFYLARGIHSGGVARIHIEDTDSFMALPFQASRIVSDRANPPSREVGPIRPHAPTRSTTNSTIHTMSRKCQYIAQ
jgi:hypothetical protein